MADVDGGHVVGWRRGAGTAALVLHGGPLSDYTGPLVDLLPPSLAAARYQQRGLAPSTTAEPLGVDQHVADAVRVLDALGFERAWLIGHSWGGHLAFHIAVTHPARVRGVIAIDPLGAVGDGGWPDLDRNLFDRMRRADPERAARAQEIDERAMAGQATTDELEESMALVWPYYFARPEAAPAMPDLRLSVPLYAAVVASVHEHLARGTLAAALPKLVMPFLVVHGAADPLPVAASRATVDLVPDAALEVISDCGHWPWLEQPARLREIVARFLYERG